MKAVIFDCDGVLVDSEALAEGVLEEYLGKWLPDLNIAELARPGVGNDHRRYS